MNPRPMDEAEPPPAIYVLKDGARIGPFEVDDLLELVESGEISYDDVCLRAGSVECERVRQVLDWEDDEAPPAKRERRADSPEEAEEDWDEDDDQVVAEDGTEECAPAGELPGPPRRGPALPPRDPGAILYAGHPSVLSFPKTLLLIAAAIGAGIVLRENSGWWLFAGLIVALFGVSWILLERSMKLYLITPKRVEVVTGFIAKSSHEVRIEDIRAINVHRPGIAGLIGVGTVEFASAGGADIDVAFSDVYAAYRIKVLVRRLQDAGSGE